MPAIKKFEPAKVSAAMKLLRALPGKDNRKSLNETLFMLSSGIQAAIAKGYSRREIRNMLAEAVVVISTTSLNNFLNAEQRSPFPERPKGTPVMREPRSMRTSAQQQVKTTGMNGAQKKLVPGNSIGLLEKQEAAETQACIGAV